ncbi:uncharacterized protein N7482_005280 [Penicillium canariense]|uniref:S-adenosyl-L-methionine-dependent methyltransferase n=1 Tax=Penicillium canariense TaxID=189055 RepID=A0A9W9I242_9EURO|nr:uncharacterized protein N7482_005280 [Penicillium canariense]KAJ5166499.1 hypothetical protein N7482_005280 [Penicillium canariense]
MPRIPTATLVRAYQENSLLPLLLKECRSLDSARNELRWLRERALRDSPSSSRLAPGARLGWRTRLRSMCRQRSQGVPLQYILGDQPFGDLEILCRRGVLIPRPETESYTYEAARLVRQMALEGGGNSTDPTSATRPLRILDLCTGTGCIALLLHALLAPHFKHMQIIGIDLSPIALNLARKNLDHNVRREALHRRARADIQFHRADVLGRKASSIPAVEEILSHYALKSGLADISVPAPRIDLLISNPPYISTSDFRNGTTARSVRLFEPRLALVPPVGFMGQDGDRSEDVFYRRILDLSLKVHAQVTVLECGDIMQADRVVEMHRTMTGGSRCNFNVEVWPTTEQDLAAHGFHPQDGSRCVIIHGGRDG